jgi:hypothetical protein
VTYVPVEKGSGKGEQSFKQTVNLILYDILTSEITWFFLLHLGIPEELVREGF